MPKIEMDMPELPEGWEYTGEYRAPVAGEFSRNEFDKSVSESVVDGSACFPIVRRVQKWRPAKLDDLDKGLKCRVRDKQSESWIDGVLTGWNSNAAYGPWLRDGSRGGWKFCEVLDQ